MDQNSKGLARTSFIGVAVVIAALAALAIFQRQRSTMIAPPYPRPHIFENRPLVLSYAQMFRRNPARSGHSSELLRTPVRLFKRVAPLNSDIHPASKSSPVFDDSGMYFGTDSGRFIKVSWQGDIIWDFKIASSRGIHGSAVITDHDVWFGAYNGNLYRLDKETGKPIWMTAVGETIGSSPLLIGRELFVTVEWNDPHNGGLVKVNAENGQVIWQTPLLGEQIHSSPAFDEKNHAVVFGANHGAIFSVSADKGDIKWIHYTGDAVKSTPAISGGRIFVTSWDGFFYCLDGSNGQKIWRAPLNEASQSSPTLIPEIDQVIIGDDLGYVRSFLMSSGKSKWTSELEGQVVGSASAFRSGTNWRIAIGCQAATLCLFDEKGNLLQELDSRSAISGEPGVFRGKIFAVSDRSGLWIWE